MIQLLFNRLQAVMTVLLSAALLFSCSQIETFETPDLSEAQARIPVSFKSINPNARVGDGYNACGTPLTAKLMAGQNIPIGEVTVFNDEEKFYVTVSIDKGPGFDDGDWFITKIHGYFGHVEVDFVTKGKKGIINPAPGKFPINESIDLDFGVADQEYTFELEIDDYLKGLGEFDVAIHADVVRVENIVEVDGAFSADIVQSESAWGEGQRFNPEGLGNWSMYLSYTIQECDDDVCNPNWTRSFTMSGQQNTDIDYPDNDELEVDFQVNGASGGKVGVVTVKRTGNSPNYTFTATFVPDAGYTFNEISICVNDEEFIPEDDDDEDDSPAVCSTLSGPNVVSVGTTNSKTVGPGTSGRSNYVTISAISSACD